jgi:hypothetical protein
MHRRYLANSCGSTFRIFRALAVAETKHAHCICCGNPKSNELATAIQIDTSGFKNNNGKRAAPSV